jgi:hypothetical protein
VPWCLRLRARISYSLQNIPPPTFPFPTPYGPHPLGCPAPSRGHRSRSAAEVRAGARVLQQFSHPLVVPAPSRGSALRPAPGPESCKSPPPL